MDCKDHPTVHFSLRSDNPLQLSGLGGRRGLRVAQQRHGRRGTTGHKRTRVLGLCAVLLAKVGRANGRRRLVEARADGREAVRAVRGRAKHLHALRVERLDAGDGGLRSRQLGPRVDLRGHRVQLGRNVESGFKVVDRGLGVVGAVGGEAQPVLLELVVVDLAERVVRGALRQVDPSLDHGREQRRVAVRKLGGVVRLVGRRGAHVAAARESVVVVGPQAVDGQLALDDLELAAHTGRKRVDVLMRHRLVDAIEQIVAELRNEKLLQHEVVKVAWRLLLGLAGSVGRVQTAGRGLGVGADVDALHLARGRHPAADVVDGRRALRGERGDGGESGERERTGRRHHDERRERGGAGPSGVG